MKLITNKIRAAICAVLLSVCTAAGGAFAQKIDCDLTWMSSTMIYAEVWNMLSNPESYIGKTIRIRGNYNPFTEEATGDTYHLILITDATACCQQGLEFKLKGGAYPSKFEFFEITGVYSKYTENGGTYYYVLADSWTHAEP